MSTNETGNDLTEQPVIERAMVTVTEPVDGTPRQRALRSRPPSAARAAEPVHHIKVHPLLMPALRAARAAGIKVVIVSETEFVEVNRRRTP